MKILMLYLILRRPVVNSQNSSYTIRNRNIHVPWNRTLFPLFLSVSISLYVLSSDRVSARFHVFSLKKNIFILQHSLWHSSLWSLSRCHPPPPPPPPFSSGKKSQDITVYLRFTQPAGGAVKRIHGNNDRVTRALITLPTWTFNLCRL